ncbi:uncharacterized protein LOC6570140 [Drosophila grimshawi]|uniref:GH25100 n=1 Tax=Drosophila grimshawi TaxID=7222 RepID=B4JZB6_DROGR|nr:uncharacterized protein LOC6570140 [Drosophila grimshawi]EDV94038.1 GH25100 [Drosophila grimshawi]
MYLTSSFFYKSASAPELYARSVETQTQKKKKTTASNEFHTPSGHTIIDAPETTQLEEEEEEPPQEQPSRSILSPTYSRLAFLANVYVLLGLQVLLSTLQWLGATYRWRPSINPNERSFFVLLLLLTWLNLSLGFIGFRRLQNIYPLNWIVFACMFESLTLLIMCLSMRELDLTWYFIVIGMAVLVIYTPFGLWMPPLLPANLWILIFSSLTVVLISALALITGLAMHCYVPLCVNLMVFGPWTMYNTHKLHAISREYITEYSYLHLAAKMYIAYGCTVGALVIVYRITNTAIESEDCQDVMFCQKRSMIHTFEVIN